jgi:uncharacterized oligopeptide transporter (OPT) family protein
MKMKMPSEQEVTTQLVMPTAIKLIYRITTVLLVFAFVATIIAAFLEARSLGGWSAPHLGWFGLSLYFLSIIVSR